MAGSLTYMNLSWNHLNGVLPMEIGNFKHLDMLDVSGNILEGEIPSSLGNCDGLTVLRLQDNLFHGSIPQPLSSLRSVEELDLSNNNFYGQIPKFVEALKYLEKLNLFYNHLEGALPTQGVFKNVSATFVAGNEKLCGGMPEFELPKCVSRNSKRRGEARKLKLTVAIIFGLLGITLIVTFLYLCWLKQKGNEPVSSSLDDSLLNLSYGTLLKVTNGFSLTNLIGSGSFGFVYKGTLQENGNAIAVKVLNLTRHGALKSFKAECETLKHIKHRNLLKILTVCSSTDYKGNLFKALVYEFMVNGSLEEWLHPNPASNDVHGHLKTLNLIQRVNISIDVASALDYLHNQCESPIIHCDLKPSNVLLDADMVGHVGDFGLAKIVLESTSDTRANLSSAGLRGTVGYAAPEYANGSQVSRKGDVYNYGVLLLEMFTGLCPTSEMFRDNLNLHNYVAEALPQRAMEITDPVLLHERGESHNSNEGSRHERSHIFQECLETVYRIGLACSMEEPRRRMSFDNVTAQLHSIRKKLFAASLLG
ncbi:probable LRR receptor-like serine/threonine-protein kinase At3g47570 [Rhodamnia argentea]|uniref:Probable LRR receptor-like serine/threonine-protein kinase At3g47570 n=1 Tax=Rhodamnia argentea TaxID=178133 RepID=A0ABM3H0K7_9MYRT|nr:probable LRR receptor-like serine/threonine-protein kinase At3g47570 [Rhodamnia argentea]